MSARTIAIVPATEWREALLGDGPCGSRAPRIRVRRHWGADEPCVDDGCPLRHALNEDQTFRLVEAHPLLWQGQPVPDGIARALGAVNRWGILSADLASIIGLAEVDEDGLDSLRKLVSLMVRVGIAAEIIEVSDG